MGQLFVFKTHFCSYVKCFFCCFFCYFCILKFSSGEVEDNIKSELIGGGYPRHLNTFSNLFIVAVHYTHNT